MLYRKALGAVGFCLRDTFHDLINLPLKEKCLTLQRKWELLQLTVADDDGVIVSGSNPGTELFAVLLLKVFRRGNKDIRCRVELQILCAPLLREVIGNDN